MKSTARSWRFFVVAGLIGASLSFAACTKGGAAGDIQQQYTAMDAALNKKDLAQYMAHFAPDLSVKNDKGRIMHHDDYQSMMSESLKASGELQVSSSASNIVVNGDTATADCTSHLKGKSAVLSDNKAHDLDATTTTKDTWKNLPKEGWKLASMEETSRKISVDGTPQTPSK